MYSRILTITVLLTALSASAGLNGPIGAAERRLTPELMWKLARVGPPSVAPDGSACVVDVGVPDLSTDEIGSQVWLVPTDGSPARQLTTAAGRSSGPKWSPDGKWIAFVSKRTGDDVAQIYVISPTGGEARRVSKLPAAPTALKWSGDSKSVYAVMWTWPGADDAAHQAKEKSLQSSKSKAVVIDAAQYRYWDKWTADGKRPTVMAVDVSTGTHRDLLKGTGMFLPPTEPGAGDYDVAPDGSEICFVSDSSADYGTDFNSDLFILPLTRDGKMKNITIDNPATDTSPVYSPDGKSILFLRQTIKFFYADRARVMLHDRTAGKSRELNEGFDRTAQNPRWLPDGKRFAFEAENAGVVDVFFGTTAGGPPRFETSGESERSTDFGKTARVGVYLKSSFQAPARLWAHRPGSPPKPLHDFNRELLDGLSLGKVESRTFKGADDKDVQMWVVYPPGFDPKKKWPLVQVVHGGPHNGIMNEWSFRWNLQAWAARGYVIGCVNFHGSSGFGQAFTDSITGDVGTKPLTDIMKSTDWFAEQPWIDKNRMAAAGASYGGYMMAWINGHTDRFKVMVCHAGVYDWHAMAASDFVRARERILGAPPWEGLERVDRQSAHRLAAKFKTPTLILHGEKDYRVPLTQGMAYYNTLRQKGVPTRFVYFPDENHWVLKPNNAQVWHREVFGWLEKYVGTGPTP